MVDVAWCMVDVVCCIFLLFSVLTLASIARGEGRVLRRRLRLRPAPWQTSHKHDLPKRNGCWQVRGGYRLMQEACFIRYAHHRSEGLVACLVSVRGHERREARRVRDYRPQQS